MGEWINDNMKYDFLFEKIYDKSFFSKELFEIFQKIDKILNHSLSNDVNFKFRVRDYFFNKNREPSIIITIPLTLRITIHIPLFSFFICS